MKLNELDQKNHASKALKENFDIDFNVSALNKIKTKTMLTKVNGLISESTQSTDFYKTQTSPAYMQLVFMEQALSAHYKELSNSPSVRIVVENEEVAKSQVILASQDMIDTVQKMLEDINDMMIKELPALVNSIQSDIGVNESRDFNTKANEALEAINVTLQSSKTMLESALGLVTGQAPDDDFGVDSLDDEEPSLDMTDMDDDFDDEVEFDEPEDLPNNVGRELR